MPGRRPLPPVEGAPTVERGVVHPEQVTAATSPPPAPAPATPAPARRRARGAPAAETAAPPTAPPSAVELDPADVAHWRWHLGAVARKARAAQARAAESTAAWEALVARARAEGVPERMVIAAAADADLDPPPLP
jgi:hypothetical protein